MLINNNKAEKAKKEGQDKRWDGKDVGPSNANYRATGTAFVSQLRLVTYKNTN